ncbi:MAG TPA: hypothetical protein VF759_09350 [Allosphingosinicella sp.]|jgi:hypothetical protein
MLSALLPATAAIAILAFAPAPEGPRPAPDCRDDRGVDRCAAGQQRRVRELYRLKSIEEHQAAGDQVRRVFYVDGYGRDLIAIAFVRSPGQDPAAWVHFPAAPRPAPAPPMQSLAPKAVWEEMLDRSWLFDRRLVAEKPEGPVICMHAWVYTIEATDPAGPAGYEKSEPPRRKTGDACSDELAQDYGDEVAKAALPLFPACAALDPEQHCNAASQLAACAILRGDRMAAAEVLNRAGAFRRAREAGESVLLRGLFASRATVDWNGSVGRDALRLHDFWLARLEEAGRPAFYVESVEGLSSQRVRLIGTLTRTEERPAGERTLTARVEQIWHFTPAREYQVESVKVGPFEPAP